MIPEQENPQSFNRYSYVRNSPLVRVDPTGNKDIDCAGGVVTCQFGRPVSPPGGKTYTRADRVAMAEMIYREEGSVGSSGMTAAAWVALNRFIKQNFEPYESLLETIADPGQFQGYTDSTASPSDEAWRLTRDIMRGWISDPTGGNIFFGNSSPTNKDTKWIGERAEVLYRLDPVKYNYIKIEGDGSGDPMYIFSYDYTDSSLAKLEEEQKQKEEEQKESSPN